MINPLSAVQIGEPEIRTGWQKYIWDSLMTQTRYTRAIEPFYKSVNRSEPKPSVSENIRLAPPVTPADQPIRWKAL